MDKQPTNNNATLEIERKYLIAYPDLKMLSKCPRYNATEITQAYLINDNSTGGGMRIRKRGTNGNYVYYKTFKRDITPIKRIEIEEVITVDEYSELIKKADPTLNIIRKVRHCFEYENQMFELDTYSFWNDRATLELELESEEQQVNLPPYIKVIKEVTQDLRYRNRSLAKNVITEQL